MIIYGTKITSDIGFPLYFPDNAQSRYMISLRSGIPENIRSAITCCFPFYRAHDRKIYLYSDSPMESSRTGQPWCYEVRDIIRFYWQGGERTIYYKLGKSGTPDLLCFWFVHLLLPLFFTLENMFEFLHAGAVEVSGRPILFIAPSMGGKSTLTDYFVRQGHPLLSDDKVPTFIEDNRFMAVPSHPYHRPYRKFEDLGHRVERIATSFSPIHAFYALEQAEPDAEIQVSEIPGYKKFEILLPSYLYMFSFLKPQRLRYLSSMVNTTQVFRILVPRNLERLPEVHAAICTHSRTFT